MNVQEIEQHFISLVTVDFYNHATETTQLKAGLTGVNYQTQFSFVNKMDNFYVNFLQKNSIKLDLYASRQKLWSDLIIKLSQLELVVGDVDS